ncbi:hypothetical protein KUTeg_005780 [Tegillarca granosa]|uniref:Uncharacterized protein n=1 Tax=Tegillarca granosa TaxID=220873 RepID=A0ABQ9FH71_TEGGR|nr:hypothetical protein KUTeg_005780 [Tegillarca granosa]
MFCYAEDKTKRLLLTDPVLMQNEISYAGGSGYGDTGGSSEFLCLTPNPKFTSKTLPNQYAGHLYGTEYESLNFFAHNAQDEDVPCSVCRSRYRRSQLMIPGTYVCPNRWKKEYSGNLAGNNHNNAGPENWVCLDDQPEFLQGGSRNDNGRVLHPIITTCGSLQCPPYENNKIVTCTFPNHNQIDCIPKRVYPEMLEKIDTAKDS